MPSLQEASILCHSGGVRLHDIFPSKLTVHDQSKYRKRLPCSADGYRSSSVPVRYVILVDDAFLLFH